MNAPVLVDVEGETDPLQIAIKEFAGKEDPAGGQAVSTRRLVSRSRLASSGCTDGEAGTRTGRARSCFSRALRHVRPAAAEIERQVCISHELVSGLFDFRRYCTSPF